MLVFLDFEASSLGKHSYPIEIAWVFEDGRSRSSLIKPAPGWTDWSAEAEAIHGISRDMLVAQGEETGEIVDEMLSALSGHDLLASAPSWDGKWMSSLLRASGRPRHALRLRKSDDALVEVARSQLGPDVTDSTVKSLVDEIILATEPDPPVHRALPDALLEHKRWRLVREAATRRGGGR